MLYFNKVTILSLIYIRNKFLEKRILEVVDSQNTLNWRVIKNKQNNPNGKKNQALLFFR